MLWGLKNVKHFEYCLCSSCRAQFLSDLFYIYCMNWWVSGLTTLSFFRPGVKIKQVIAILSPGVKIMLWGVKIQKHKKFLLVT